NPEDEEKVSSISRNLIEGNYFTDGKKNEILIGEKLAVKLRVKLHNKVVLTFQSKTGEITAGSFRIAGIFRSRNSSFDESTVFTRKEEIADLLGTGNEIHEIAILLKNDDACDGYAAELQKQNPALLVQTWKDLSPELELVIDSFKQYMYIFIAIILLALMFGIVNTMLMAVLERQREIGILMAIGLNRWRLFSMIILETILLVMIGIPAGLLLTELSVSYFGNHGIDISAFSQGLARYGFSNVIRPELDASMYLPVALMTTGAAIISAIYPARKALKMKPAVAIRKI
ncbi:MAG TPA: FtsX-like permease family protein, partial [Bacteroidia bacterium]|nr:FtsX-like permease family protein [Bacteroidia bacterium]